MVRLVKIDVSDNVAILTEAACQGTRFPDGVILQEDIPQAHKVALKDLEKGEAVIRYGVVLGYLLKAVVKGGWINETSLELPG